MAPETTIWEAPEHTKAKIAILKNYLQAWFPILERRAKGEEFLYIDGFAGPGEYTNYPEGSPIAALEAARKALQDRGNWKAGTLHFAFIEKDKERFDNLREKVKPYEGIKQLGIHMYNTSFVDGLARVKIDIPSPFISTNPLFVFIDPFGATGAPFESVAEILASPRSEALIYLDTDGIARIFRARSNPKNLTHLNDAFGGDSWRYALLDGMEFNEQCKAVLALYKSNLLKLLNVRYVYHFEIRSSGSRADYYLVFASQHRLGLVKMKESMKPKDQSGDFSFTDANINQPMLLRFDEPELHHIELFRQFQGKTVLYETIWDYVLLHTPFANPKKLITFLEKEKAVKIRRVGHERGVGEGDFIEFKSDYPATPPSQLPLM